ncbi:hypothetical protein OS493_038753, partial [Desmophyllum pertusum]
DAQVEENRTIRETEIVRNQDAQVKETVRLEKQKLYETRTPKSKKPYDLRDRNCTIPVKAVTRPSIVTKPIVRENPFASLPFARNHSRAQCPREIVSRKGAYIGLEVQDISDPDESYEEKHSEKRGKREKNFEENAFTAGGLQVPANSDIACW